MEVFILRKCTLNYDFEENSLEDDDISLYHKLIESLEKMILNTIEKKKNNIKKLKEVNISNCDLSKGNKCKLIGLVLTAFNDIQHASFSENLLNKNDVEWICKGLSNSSKKLKNISLIDCNLREENCQFIEELLNKCSELENLNFSSNCNINNGIISICNEQKTSLNSFSNS